MARKLETEWLSKKHVAARLGVCVRSVNNMVERGELAPPRRFSRQLVRWHVSTLPTPAPAGKHEAQQ